MIRRALAGLGATRSGWLLIAWALTVRGNLLADARRAPFWAYQLVDETAYSNLAHGLLHHTPLPHGAWYVAPGYAYLLAGAFGAGFGPTAVKIAQLVCGVLNVWLVWRLARRTARPAIAAVAAAVWATAPAVLLQELLLLKTTFATCGLLLGLDALVTARRPRHYIVAGAAMGAATLLRGELAAVALWVAAAGFVARRRGWPGAPPRAGQAWFLAVWLAALAIPTVQNARGARVFVPVAFGGGTNLYIGNHPGADGSYVPLRPDRFDPAQEEADAVELASRALGHPADPAAVSRYWTREALRFWLRTPAAAARLTLRKLAMVLGPWEAADVISTGQAGRWVRALRNPVAVPALILPLAVAGFFALRRRREVWLLHTAFVAGIAAIVPFFVFERFRVPLLAMAVPFAAAAADHAWCALRARRLRAVLAAAAAGLAVVLLTRTVRAPRDETVLRVNIGELFFQAGRYDEAMQEFEAVRAASPAAWRVGINIANVETARGRTADALRALEPVLDRLHAEADRTGQPSREELAYCHELAGDLLHDSGALAPAAAHYGAALPYAPPAAQASLRAKLAACDSSR